MKTKTNKEIIEEFRKEFRPEYTGGGSIKNIIAYGKKLKSVKVDLSDVESFILQALEQKEREVRERLGLNKKCLIYADNHNFILRKCVDCGLIISEEQEKNIILKSKTT